jgi:hypothetical protein
LIAPGCYLRSALGIDPVLVIETIRSVLRRLSEASPLSDVVGSAVETAGFEVKTKLGRNDDLLAERCERFSDEVRS